MRVATGILACSLAMLASTAALPEARHRSAAPVGPGSTKGDRLSRGPAATTAGSVVSAKLRGGDGARVLSMFDAQGRLVFQADHAQQVTRVAKGVALLAAALPDAEPMQVPAARGTPVGCEKPVSGLARAGSANKVARCLT